MARKIKRLSDEALPEASEEWLVTYADTITLLMCFFVLTTGISHVDLNTFEKVSGAFSQGFGKREVNRPIASLESAVNQVFTDYQISSDVVVGTDRDGLVIEVPSNLLFNEGSGNLRGDGAGVLKEVLNEIVDEKYVRYNLKIEAHASAASSRGSFDSLWDLTSKRATSVARFFVFETPGFNEAVFEASRVQAISFGDSRPRTEVAQVRSVGGGLGAVLTDDRIVVRMGP